SLIQAIISCDAVICLQGRRGIGELLLHGVRARTSSLLGLRGLGATGRPSRSGSRESANMAGMDDTEAARRPVARTSSCGTARRHFWVGLDYRNREPNSEPSVVWIDNEIGDELGLAPNFRTSASSFPA